MILAHQLSEPDVAHSDRNDLINVSPILDLDQIYRPTYRVLDIALARESMPIECHGAAVIQSAPNNDQPFQ